MRFISLSFVVFLSIVSALEAQIPRAFVSSSGNDANPCSRIAPCRNFAAAVAAIPSGEVIVLDSAGYGPVTITKSVSIIAPAGVYAGIAAPSGGLPGSGDSILIDAGQYATVTLRGLTLNSAGAVNGIRATSVHTLVVENCVLTGFSVAALSFSSATGGHVYISDTVARFNLVAFDIGAPAGYFVTGSIERSRAQANGMGFLVHGDSWSKVTVHDCTATDNFNGGFEADGAILNVTECVATGNFTGIKTKGNAMAMVAHSYVADNTVGFSNVAGIFRSFGNNALHGNTTTKEGTIDTIAHQ